MTSNGVYVGLNGTVVALDRNSGNEVWRTNLGVQGFVNVVLDGDRLLATARGEVFCLELVNGKIIWRNQLKGMGRGVVSIASAHGQSAVAPFEVKRSQDEAAAMAAIGGGG